MTVLFFKGEIVILAQFEAYCRSAMSQWRII